MARCKAHGRLSICLNWTFFAVYYGSGAMRQNVYSSAVFKGGRPLCSQIILGQGHPTCIVGIRNLETLGYPTVKTASLCVPSFWHNTGVWRMDLPRNIYRACKASFVARCKNIKTFFTSMACTAVNCNYHSCPAYLPELGVPVTNSGALNGLQRPRVQTLIKIAD